MSRLFMLMVGLALGTCAGIGVIIALTLGYYNWQAIVLFAAVGAVAALPIAWLATRQIQATDPKDSLD